MELKEKNLSLQFYNYLCDIIGSEEVVRRRRQIFTANDFGGSITFANCLSSGSKAEGLDIKGSDYDQMMQLKFIRVYESLDDIQSYPDKIPLVMVNNDTKPGFTKLKLASKLFFDRLVYNAYISTDVIRNWFEIVGEETFISSKRFREQHLNSCDDLVMHGPCQSSSNGELDAAICFRFNSTPDRIYLKYANTLAEQTIFNQIKQKWGLLYAFKYLMIDGVEFLKPFYLLPHELKPLIVDEYCSIPPVVYSYVLKFLCCHQLGYNRGKHDALHDLELTIRNQYLILPIQFTFRNIYKCLSR
ncbi:unnamed protein product [Mytilus edulis]|uniref:Uncharacterized protein n=1 Tax=Mytilus edulis TaxID=6550 RepID=A0A8S3QSR5_MYTED|nr:unnamed protein product [Mytilus edulis]